jgi:hypothetical protein
MASYPSKKNNQQPTSPKFNSKLSTTKVIQRYQFICAGSYFVHSTSEAETENFLIVRSLKNKEGV